MAAFISDLKSKDVYKKVYASYTEWKSKIHPNTGTSEGILLEYMSFLKTKYGHNSIWQKMSIIKTQCALNEGVNPRDYVYLNKRLKRDHDNNISRQANVLDFDDVRDWLDICNIHKPKELLDACVFIIAFFSAGRECDIVHMSTDQLCPEYNDKNEILGVWVTLSKRKTKAQPQRYWIPNKEITLSPNTSRTYACILEHYINALKRDEQWNGRLWKYTKKDGRYCKKVVGKGVITTAPKRIAKDLGII